VCGRLAVKVCPGCLESLAGHHSKFCAECGNEDPCARHTGGLVCRSVSLYRGVNQDVVREMKYSSHKSVAVMMGRIMANSTQKPVSDFLVPIPLHKGSEREYNQAELIARGASEVWGIPVNDCVRWKNASPNQASLPGGRNRKLPGEAMETTKDVREKRIFLIDDVCTTGNTLVAASMACKRSGAPVAGAMVWSRSG